MRRIILNTLQAILASALATSSARADLISVNSLGTVTMDAGTLSSVYTIGLKDLNPGAPVTLIGWSLGLRIVPLGGAIGTVTFHQPSFADAMNNIFQGGPHAPGPLGVSGNNPAAGDFTLSNTDNALTGVVAPGTTRGLVDLRFSASALASGDFALRLIDLDDSSPASLVNTYWFDDAFEQHYLTVEGAAFSSGIQLGTIHVNVASVPEPSSLVLMGGAIAAVAIWPMRHRKRRPSNQPPAV